MTKALRSDVFYTQALLGDAAFQIYVELPVKKPAKASMVFAMLNTRAQDIGPYPPSEITRVGRAGPPRLCGDDAAGRRDRDDAGMRGAMECREQEGSRKRPANQAPGQSFGDLSEAIRCDGDAEFHRCFAERAPREGRSPRWCGRRRKSSTACRNRRRRRRAT